MSELTPDEVPTSIRLHKSGESPKNASYWRRMCQAVYDQWQSQLAERDGLIERLKQEAQAHAMEARAHRSTVHECYQAVGAQKGNWNGATPIVDAVAGYKKRIAELENAVQKTLDENLHLADGDNCTLIRLKTVLRQTTLEKLTQEAQERGEYE